MLNLRGIHNHMWVILQIAKATEKVKYRLYAIFWNNHTIKFLLFGNHLIVEVILIFSHSHQNSM